MEKLSLKGARRELLAVVVAGIAFAAVKFVNRGAETPQENVGAWREVPADELRGPDTSIDPFAEQTHPPQVA